MLDQLHVQCGLDQTLTAIIPTGWFSYTTAAFLKTKTKTAKLIKINAVAREATAVNFHMSVLHRNWIICYLLFSIAFVYMLSSPSAVCLHSAVSLSKHTVQRHLHRELCSTKSLEITPKTIIPKTSIIILQLTCGICNDKQYLSTDKSYLNLYFYTVYFNNKNNPLRYPVVFPWDFHAWTMSCAWAHCDVQDFVIQADLWGQRGLTAKTTLNYVITNLQSKKNKSR